MEKALAEGMDKELLIERKLHCFDQSTVLLKIFLSLLLRDICKDGPPGCASALVVPNQISIALVAPVVR